MSAFDMNPLDSQLLRRNSDPAAIISQIATAQIVGGGGDDEQPLDFSKKSRNNSSNSESLPRSDESNSPPAYFSPPPSQQNRPSVITCAPTLRTKLTSPSCQRCTLSPNGRGPDHQCHRSHQIDKAHHHHKAPPPYAHHHERRLVISEDPPTTPERLDNHYQQSRKHPPSIRSPNSSSANVGASADACDPMIDEHFRRSLGQKYDLFSKSPSVGNNKPATVSNSVDDHFAKALGEAWTKLQTKDSGGGKQQPSPSVVS